MKLLWNYVKVAVVKIGNFREIRVSKVVLEQCRIENEVNMEIDNQKAVDQSDLQCE